MNNTNWVLFIILIKLGVNVVAGQTKQKFPNTKHVYGAAFSKNKQTRKQINIPGVFSKKLKNVKKKYKN